MLVLTTTHEMNNMNYEITLNGCDDWTTIEIELSETELALVKKIKAKVNKKSTYHCMPTMTVTKLK